ncbi:hypothetical protein RFI_11546 [Reticulomyxa filosa]|uniref:Uncharacterized protein n=1 Tax=Reticulomyxa filosa TaxID=46433 RepID=X6NIN8_RETFI|nr:hypothetical protein RFI_11546 [Reticulomyxa filosa]|eukprot:ETO25594.1 hypothetical protein RFI_11546 [Reticulomyxa filosa]
MQETLTLTGATAYNEKLTKKLLDICQKSKKVSSTDPEPALEGLKAFIEKNYASLSSIDFNYTNFRGDGILKVICTNRCVATLDFLLATVIKASLHLNIYIIDETSTKSNMLHYVVSGELNNIYFF